jgi:3-oxoacyl-[acyl-carrier protein] reductase
MMKARTGKIVNVASVVGVMGNGGQANYSASKAGVIGLTKTVAKELGARGITVNAVAPGYIQTDMTGELSDSARDAFLNAVPLKRPGLPLDVARVVKFLAGSDSDYVTGQVINVCGGMLM